MPDPEKTKPRKRVVVEEVAKPEATEEKVSETIEEKPVDAPVKEEEPTTETVVTPPEPTPPQVVATAEPSMQSQEEKHVSPFLWILIPGIFLLGAILGGIFFYQKGVNKGQEAEQSSSPEASTSASPTASPAAQIDLTKYTIAIFNGSGTAGVAGKVKTLLETAGFTVGSTANAATYDYTKTIVKAKDAVDPAFITQLVQTLAKTYLVDTPKTLATSSSDTVQVIVGTSKAE